MSSEQKPNTNSHSDATPFIYLIMAGVIAYAVIYLILLIGVILTVCLTAGAGYLGYKAALDTELWEDRRLARDRKLEAARKRELEYFQAQGKEWMTQVVENYYDDQERELYTKDGSRIEKATQTVRKIREVFK